MKYLFLLLFSITLISCSEEEEKELLFENFPTLDNQKKGVIMPLEVGNMWVYEQTFPKKNAKVLDTMYISKKTSNEFGPVYYLESSIYPFCPDDLLINKINGLWTKRCKSILFAKYRGKKDDKWSQFLNKYPSLVRSESGEELLINLDLYGNFKILSTNSKMVVNGINYSNVYVYQRILEIRPKKYEASEVDEKIILYYKPNLGLIKCEHFLYDKLQSIFELVSYQLN